MVDYKGEPLAFGFKLVIPSSNGGEYVMPFGSDPLDTEALARDGGISFDAGARVALPGHDEVMLNSRAKASLPRPIHWRWNGRASTTWSFTQPPVC